MGTLTLVIPRFFASLLIHGTNPITDELQRSMGTFGKQTLQCHFPSSFRASSENEGFPAGHAIIALDTPLHATRNFVVPYTV